MPRQASVAAGKAARRSQKGGRGQTMEIDRHDGDNQAMYIVSYRIHVLRRAIETLAR